MVTIIIARPRILFVFGPHSFVDAPEARKKKMVIPSRVRAMSSCEFPVQLQEALTQKFSDDAGRMLGGSKGLSKYMYNPYRACSNPKYAQC